ncbi:hypothetical protein DERP_001656 [Dermatophagoides pteronyssinus]|uniref:Uncharacterized protein n=1 Tax=Dermatophagoides pteronyssinus TaxID=6956 RepID=A0ABQ8JB48_DERPT|nr:hypothetical protein DERP_001656 [Dermatophagoides pteronyssinus]
MRKRKKISEHNPNVGCMESSSSSITTTKYFLDKIFNFKIKKKKIEQDEKINENKSFSKFLQFDSIDQ